jgi:hypothetical protein
MPPDTLARKSSSDGRDTRRHTLRISDDAKMETVMPRKKPASVGQFVAFDVLYEDGTKSSNRRVPGDVLGGLDGDEPAKAIIEEQDAKIAAMSGKPRGPIKAITRSGAR